MTTLVFTNRAIWFNGICPFNLYFDSKNSDKNFKVINIQFYNSLGGTLYAAENNGFMCTNTVIPQSQPE
jgi:hypothetical protein